MIRELRDGDAEVYLALRRAALVGSPLSFASSPEDDAGTSIEVVRAQLRRGPESIVLGAFRPGLVGMLGLYRDRHVKRHHKVNLWGMYVDPAHRRQGAAAGLLQAAIAHARVLGGVEWIHLSVSSAAPDARRLYEQEGFQPWGTEPDALRHQGRSVDEHYMALCLGPDAAGGQRGGDGD